MRYRTRMPPSAKDSRQSTRRVSAAGRYPADNVTKATSASVSEVLAGSAAVAVGSSFVASSLLVNYPMLGGQALRYAGAVVALLLVARVRRLSLPAPTRREWWRLFLLAAVGLSGFNLAVLAALKTSQPAVVGAVVGCVPVVLVVVGPLSRRHRPKPRILAAAVVVVVGAVLVQGFGYTDTRGLLYAVGALIAETAFSLLAVPLLPRLGYLPVSLYSTALAAAQLALLGLIVDGRGVVRMPTDREALALAYLALVVTAAAFLCWYAALSRLGAERAGPFAALIPVSAALLAPLVGTGVLTWQQVFGSAIVGLGVLAGLRA